MEETKIEEPSVVEPPKEEEVKVHIPVKYEVVVKYNHYKEKFPVVDGVLQE